MLLPEANAGDTTFPAAVLRQLHRILDSLECWMDAPAGASASVKLPVLDTRLRARQDDAFVLLQIWQPRSN